MGFYNLNLDELSEYTDTSIEELKTKSYTDLEKMINNMTKEKFIEQNNKNAKDAEYERLVLKYFLPLPLLRHWFDDREIIFACAHTGITEHDLCQELCVNLGSKCYYSNSEYLRTSWEYVPQYDNCGRVLLKRKREKRDVYRITSHYQHCSHGQVIRHLLYERYPELSKFGFETYGMHSEENYEIYPKNGIYIPFAALMSGDIDFIIHRNREYCKSYNNGRYSPEECEKAFRTKEVLEMFDLIRIIGEKERAAGHLQSIVNEKGLYENVYGMTETNTSASGNIKLLQKDRLFKLDCAAPYALDRLLYEYLDMVKPVIATIHIYSITDYLGENGINLKVKSGESKQLNLKDENGKDYSGYIVHSTFGWSYGEEYDLTVRINPYHK